MPIDVQVAGADGSKKTWVVGCDLQVVWVVQNAVQSRTGEHPPLAWRHHLISPRQWSQQFDSGCLLGML